MNHIKLLVLLLLTYCNVNTKNISDISNIEIEQKPFNVELFDTPCTEIFYSINNKTAIIKGQLYLHNPKIEIREFLNCSFLLASKGEEKAKKFMLDLFSEMKVRLADENVSPLEIYNLALISESVPNKNSFELLMKYFSIYLRKSNFHVSPRHDDSGYELGYSTYNLLLDMMNEGSRTFYQKLYDDKVLDFAADQKDNGNMVLLYSQIYPILKQDWELGKIKLREPTSDQ